MRYFIFTILVVFGCASQPKIEEFKTSTIGGDARPNQMTDVSSLDSSEISYVVIHKTQPLYFQRDVNGEYLQFITPKESERFQSSVRNEERKIIEAEKEKFRRQKEKRLKRERAKKKKQKARKKRKKKRKKKLTKKQRARAKKAAILKREKEKNKKVREQRKRADSKVRAAQKRIQRRFPDGNIHSFFAFRKLKTDGDWVQVETISQSVDMPHCHQAGLERLGDLKMRFWVKRDAIGSVISRSVIVEAAVGAPSRLLPGLGVLEENGKQSVFVSGFKLDVDLENDAISKSYTPQRGMEISMTDTVFSSMAIAKGLRFGKTKLPINPFFSKYVSQTLRVDSKNYASFQSRCAEVFVRTREGDIEHGGPRKAARFSGGAFSNSETSIRSGGKIALPSGTEVGIVLKAFPISRQDGNCFNLKVWKGSYGKRDVRLCANWDE